MFFSIFLYNFEKCSFRRFSAEIANLGPVLTFLGDFGGKIGEEIGAKIGTEGVTFPGEIFRGGGEEFGRHRKR